MKGQLQLAEAECKDINSQINSKPIAEKSVELFQQMKLLKDDIELKS